MVAEASSDAVVEADTESDREEETVSVRDGERDKLMLVDLLLAAVVV